MGNMNDIKEILGEIFEQSHNLDLNLNFNWKVYKDSLNLFDKNYKRDTLVSCYMTSLSEELNELKTIYAYSVIANKVSLEIENIALKNHIIYYQRNYHFGSFFPKFYSLLDHIAYMINQFSKLSLVTVEKSVDMYNIRKELYRYRVKISSESLGMIGYISSSDLNKIIQIIDTENIYGSIESSSIKLHRNTAVHKHYVEYGVNLNPHFYIKDGNLCFVGGTKYPFDDYICIAHNLLINLYKIINDLAKLDLMKDVICEA